MTDLAVRTQVIPSFSKSETSPEQVPRAQAINSISDKLLRTQKRLLVSFVDQTTKTEGPALLLSTASMAAPSGQRAKIPSPRPNQHSDFSAAEESCDFVLPLPITHSVPSSSSELELRSFQSPRSNFDTNPASSARRSRCSRNSRIGSCTSPAPAQ